MNFDLTEDEEMLKALAERFVADRYDTERRRGYLALEHGFSPDNWALLGELGLIAAPLPGEAGGADLDPTAIATVFEALGKGLVVEPLLEAGLLAARLFARTAPAPLRLEWGEALASGARRLALAHGETGGRGGHLWVETRARANGRGTILSGSKAYVIAGAGADGYIVSARHAGEPGSREGVSFYLVPVGAPGLDVRPWRMADGSMAATLTLDNVTVPFEAGLAATLDDLDEAATLASLARSAEAIGIMERLFADTSDYLRTREQFGQPLGSFQALQHRMAAQWVVLEQARALTNLALVSWAGGDDAAGFAQAVAGLRAYLAPASLTFGHEMIQFHGGMGVTDELAIGAGHKRLLVLSRWPDDPESALDRFAGVA